VLDRLPVHFLNAVMAAEDRRFMMHGGVDPIGTLSAIKDVLGGQLRGGSSITQQMVKNTALDSNRTIDRKIIEAILATRAHEALGPQKVLEVYLENAWFGRGQTGVMLAPQAWYGKEWTEITIAESAMLAAMLKGPAWYDPEKFPERSKERRDYVIRGMFTSGWITQEERDAALEEEISVIPYTPTVSELNWTTSLTDYVIGRDEMMRPLPQDMSDVQITTTIEPQWQDIAENSLQSALLSMGGMRPLGSVDVPIADDLTSEDDDIRAAAVRSTVAVAPTGARGERIVITEMGEPMRGAMISITGEVTPVKVKTRVRTPDVGDILVADAETDGVWNAIGIPDVQGAVVIIDPRTGNVISSVGGFDERISNFDRTRALRQPGSAIKPFLFLAALNMGYSADSWVPNTRRTYIDSNGVKWSPRNYDRSESSGMPLYQGLERSSNLVAAELISQIGPEAMAEVAEAAGAYAPGGMKRLLSSSLGVTEVRLLDLVSGYAAIMNDGAPRTPQGVTEVVAGEPLAIGRATGSGRLIAGRGPLQDLISMMRGTVQRGTASVAFRNHPVTIVGKTGTTQNYKDAWFVGMSPHVAIGIWIGKDNNTPLPNRAAGGRSAAPVAADILRQAFNAGLVDGDGLRDDLMTSGMLWPATPIGVAPVAPQFSDEDDNFIIETNEYYETTDDQNSVVISPEPIQPEQNYYDDNVEIYQSLDGAPQSGTSDSYFGYQGNGAASGDDYFSTPGSGQW
ncbi:MAG: transglycosylase domain-containing protein, partial [Roseibium sp.]|uniref:transglycosylase domain-containing protein n=1 Tax=Roseibium sp. TaxID=1936156 RepID=UPI003299D403